MIERKVSFFKTRRRGYRNISEHQIDSIPLPVPKEGEELFESPDSVWVVVREEPVVEDSEVLPVVPLIFPVVPDGRSVTLKPINICMEQNRPYYKPFE